MGTCECVRPHRFCPTVGSVGLLVQLLATAALCGWSKKKAPISIMGVMYDVAMKRSATRRRYRPPIRLVCDNLRATCTTAASLQGDYTSSHCSHCTLNTLLSRLVSTLSLRLGELLLLRLLLVSVSSRLATATSGGVDTIRERANVTEGTEDVSGEAL